MEQYRYAPQSNYNPMHTRKTKYNTNIKFMAANYSNLNHNLNHPNHAPRAPFGPKHVLDINVIRSSLGIDSLSVSDVLQLATEAILYGEMIESMSAITGRREWKSFYKNMIFVLSEGFDAVVTIVWNNQMLQTVGDNTTIFRNTSTFHPNTTRPSHEESNQFIASIETNLGSTNVAGNFDLDPEYECIIDEIVNFVDNDIDLISKGQTLPPLPPPPPVPVPVPVNHGYNSSVYGQPNVHNNNKLNYYDDICMNNGQLISSEINLSGIVYGTSLGSNHSSQHSLSSSSGENTANHGIEIAISDNLWQDLCTKFHGRFGSKQSLIRKMKNMIHTNRAPKHLYNKDLCVWVDNDFVYVTKSDMSTLVDVFDSSAFHTNPGSCYAVLNNKSNRGSSSTNNNNRSGRKLIKNSSKRSIQTVSSKRSVFSDISAMSATPSAEYHTIYLKPIIERMKTILNDSCVDTDRIIEIVDDSIKYGNKRQISKRTFEFKYQNYTIIMSKSLKTILDVTLSSDKDVITVHPDVVSIISKKCAVLDYFTIQKLANCAKLTQTYTTKKNDYRQQFIYDFCGCRIVFASNHTTIVEMQCNDTSAMNMHISTYTEKY